MAAERPPVPHAILRFVDQLGGAPSGWLVALSGGPDSVALLHALASLRQEQGWTVQAAHLHHQLRGSDSDADAHFVQELCTSLHVPCHIERRDVRALSAAAGENLEAAARHLRYEWLQALAGQLHLPWIATGHHAGDQVETVLHHLLRGTGLRGLRGIAPVRRLDDKLCLVRPLLSVTRQQILDYLQEQALSFRVDQSNTDTRWTRNRIRQELVPLLREQYHPATETHLLQLAEQAQEWQEYLAAQATALLHQAEKPRVGRLLILEQAALRAAPPLLAREVLHLLWEREGWPRSGMAQAHWHQASAVAQGQCLAADLPGGLRIKAQGRVVQLGPTAANR